MYHLRSASWRASFIYPYPSIVSNKIVQGLRFSVSTLNINVTMLGSEVSFRLQSSNTEVSCASVAYDQPLQGFAAEDAGIRQGDLLMVWHTENDKESNEFWKLR